MLGFASGMSYLRQEALKSGFILESDNDDKLVERLSQVVRKIGPEDAEHCDELTKSAAGTTDDMTQEQARTDATVKEADNRARAEGKVVEQGSDKKPKGKA